MLEDAKEHFDIKRRECKSLRKELKALKQAFDELNASHERLEEAHEKLGKAHKWKVLMARGGVNSLIKFLQQHLTKWLDNYEAKQVLR